MATIINASTSAGLIQTADTSGTLQLQSGGTTKFTVDSTGAYGQLQSGTAQATTSGTSITFSSIPSWVKRITVIFNGVSLSGTAVGLVRLGTASGIESTGYGGCITYISGTAATTNSQTSGVQFGLGNAADVLSGVMQIVNISGNIWVSYSNGSLSSSSQTQIASSVKTLSGVLTQLSITSSNGTDTFDAGSINILYE